MGKIMEKRIGIYGGAFNPVHSGHLAFALQVAGEAKLDAVFFLPERRPRQKQAVEHFAHRIAMLKRAVRPYPKFGVLEFDDVSLTVRRTLPKLINMFPDAQLVFLFGSDVISHIDTWPSAKLLLEKCEVVIGVRTGHSEKDLRQTIDSWHSRPLNIRLVPSYKDEVSSSMVRKGLRQRQAAEGTLRSVESYSNRHWLYVSVPQN